MVTTQPVSGSNYIHPNGAQNPALQSGVTPSFSSSIPAGNDQFSNKKKVSDDDLPWWQKGFGKAAVETVAGLITGGLAMLYSKNKVVLIVGGLLGGALAGMGISIAKQKKQTGHVDAGKAVKDSLIGALGF